MSNQARKLPLDEGTPPTPKRRIRVGLVGCGEVTQILIAHRLSTIEHADKIIYLERGVKIAEGNKEELLKNCEPFRRMWEALYRQSEFMEEISNMTSYT